MIIPVVTNIRARGHRALALISAFAFPTALAAQSTPDSTNFPAADTAKSAAPDSAIHVAFGAFLDSYVAYDFGRPRDIDRALTTQAVRHDEFNINLAYIGRDAQRTARSRAGRGAIRNFGAGELRGRSAPGQLQRAGLEPVRSGGDGGVQGVERRMDRWRRLPRSFRQ